MSDNPYTNRLSPAVGGGLGGLPRKPIAVAVRGEVSFCLPGVYTWIVPEGITSIATVSIAAGGGAWNGGTTADDTASGGGGALAWANDIAVDMKYEEEGESDDREVFKEMLAELDKVKQK